MRPEAAAAARLFPFEFGKYRVEAGVGEQDLARGLGLRALCFRAGEGDDRDDFDPRALHVTLSEMAGGRVVAGYRLILAPADQIEQSYAAQFYNLSRLAGFAQPTLELGRFALHPKAQDPDILRLCWAALTRIVDACDIGLLFGCSSFAGTAPEPHLDALRWLAGHHMPPPLWAPQRRGALAIELAAIQGAMPSQHLAMRAMPPLLRTYLGMGGWVSDHAVVDPDLNTLHVFTAVEIARIPPARARALREIARLLPPAGD
jgi:L-ornithine Nalpha-acyltransferase